MIRPQGSYVDSEYGMGFLAQSLSLHDFHPVPGKAGALSFLGDSSSHEELINSRHNDPNGTGWAPGYMSLCS